MELIVDDRERAVIIYLGKLYNIKVERITVGDYAYVCNGKVIVIVERKSLSDLASSIKDGRMVNNDKLLDAQKQYGCQILYIIEGCAYPNLGRKIGRIPYKSLQDKLDRLLFRHNIKIIWTKDCEHTAKRLVGLVPTFISMAKDGVFGECGDTISISNVIKPTHAINIDNIYLKMLTRLSSVSYKTAIAALQKYTIVQLLTGETDLEECYNIVYIDSGFRMGRWGVKLHNTCSSIHGLPKIQKKILACINGITINTASNILNKVNFSDIVMSKYKPGTIANIQQTEKRRIGHSIEARIKLIFPHIPVEQTVQNHVVDFIT